MKDSVQTDVNEQLKDSVQLYNAIGNCIIQLNVENPELILNSHIKSQSAFENHGENQFQRLTWRLIIIVF